MVDSIQKAAPAKIDRRLRGNRSFKYPYSQVAINARNQDIFKLYRTGDYTLNDLGEKYQVTRERIRQICAFYGDINGEQIAEIRQKRMLKKIEEKYGSAENYARLMEQKTEHRLLREAAKKTGKWHWKFDACVECGTTEKEFQAHGRCVTCAARYLYHNLPGRKESCARTSRVWAMKNRDRVIANQKVYHSKYILRPGVKERIAVRAKEYLSRPGVAEARYEYQKEYYKRPEVVERLKLYMTSPKVRAQRKLYNQRPEVKARRRQQFHARYLRIKQSKLK